MMMLITKLFALGLIAVVWDVLALMSDSMIMGDDDPYEKITTYFEGIGGYDEDDMNMMMSIIMLRSECSVLPWCNENFENIVFKSHEESTDEPSSEWRDARQSHYRYLSHSNPRLSFLLPGSPESPDPNHPSPFHGGSCTGIGHGLPRSFGVIDCPRRLRNQYYHPRPR